MLPRIAVLGCGNWGCNHIRTLKKIGALAAVSDADTNHAEKVAVKYNVVSIPVAQLFLQEDIDAIVLALPPQFHAENAIQALRNGKDVLVEKPIALNIKDAECEIQIARANRCIFMVGHVLRFHPVFETMLDLVHSGELGEIRYIRCHRLGLGKFYTASDALWDLAPHDISMILALTGAEPSEVHGEGVAILDQLADFSQLNMLFPNGLCSHLVTSRLNPYRERRLTVVGNRAMAVFDDMKNWQRKLAIYRFGCRQPNGHRQWSFADVEPEFISVEEGLALTRELQHFLHCIRTRQEPRTNGEEALAVLRILTKGSLNRDSLVEI
ncbi:MAG: Oxidoreductase family protein [Candidatus Tokpelaia sp. JSC085]|nr:MAG: Oxidoreductase family protein [Candidatus Tokpelaia sp. JSC085]